MRDLGIYVSKRRRVKPDRSGWARVFVDAVWAMPGLVSRQVTVTGFRSWVLSHMRDQ